MPLRPWNVYNVYCTQLQPPKNKFVTIVSIEPQILGFFINSNIHPYVQTQPHLLACQVKLPDNGHDFLNYTSYLNCAEVFEFSKDDLDNCIGAISLGVRRNVIQTVQNSNTLKRRHKNLILTELNPPAK